MEEAGHHALDQAIEGEEPTRAGPLAEAHSWLADLRPEAKETEDQCEVARARRQSPTEGQEDGILAGDWQLAEALPRPEKIRI